MPAGAPLDRGSFFVPSTVAPHLLTIRGKIPILNRKHILNHVSAHASGRLRPRPSGRCLGRNISWAGEVFWSGRAAPAPSFKMWTSGRGRRDHASEIVATRLGHCYPFITSGMNAVIVSKKRRSSGAKP